MTQMFECPFYIPPHAVARFRERVSGAESARRVREIINGLLQRERRRLLGYSRWNGRIAPLYAGRHEGVDFLIPVCVDPRKVNAWLVVPTILKRPWDIIHWARGDCRRKWIESLWASGMKKEAMSKILGVGLATLTRLVKGYGLPPRHRPHTASRWTEQEESSLRRLIADGGTPGEIAVYFSTHHPERPGSTIRVKIHRMKGGAKAGDM
ncbi:MAG: hypothetical protein LBQ56_02265 [Synergistaceae bacterium]|jgi:hypothetical protein|nr:hypothetical protein [Synergistaceae bacterium]